MDFITNGKQYYAQLVDLIIRPPRCEYTLDELGPKTFSIGRKKYQRTDLVVTNKRNQKLQCSHFEPVPEQRRKQTLPCVIYLHGNSGCRLDALHTLEILLPYNITMFCVDLSGSGLSDGEYISLGYYERDDVAAVVSYLRESGTVSGIGIWGRSMGAATAIMYGAMDPSIAGLVLDSPFSSLTTIAQELVENAQIKVPKLMVSLGLKLIRKTIRNKAHFDIYKLEPIAHVESSFTPALFVHGEDDTFILPHHSQTLHDKYAGDKNLILVKGDHNSPRPAFCFDSISIFFHNTLLVGEDRMDEESQSVGLDAEFANYVRYYHKDVDLITSLNNIATNKNGENNIVLGNSSPSSTSTSAIGNGGGVPQKSAADLEEELLQRALMESMQDLDLDDDDDDDDEDDDSENESTSKAVEISTTTSTSASTTSTSSSNDSSSSSTKSSSKKSKEKKKGKKEKKEKEKKTKKSRKSKSAPSTTTNQPAA